MSSKVQAIYCIATEMQPYQGVRTQLQNRYITLGQKIIPKSLSQNQKKKMVFVLWDHFNILNQLVYRQQY